MTLALALEGQAALSQVVKGISDLMRLESQDMRNDGCEAARPSQSWALGGWVVMHW